MNSVSTMFRFINNMINKETFDLICWGWILIAIILFPILTKITQPYGRHTKNNWRFMINNSMAWFLMEASSLIVFSYFVSTSANFYNKIVLIAASLWGLHYFHRAIIYPLRIKTKGKKMPLLIMVFGIFFNLINGFLNGYWLANYTPAFESSSFNNLLIILGIIVFISGFIINKYHDYLLIKLRNTGGKGYKIPYGGLFKYISCPNFLGEIISWLGFLIVTLSLPALSFLVWTIVNLVPRAIDHHKWYKKEFKDYPDKRKAIFPFLL